MKLIKTQREPNPSYFPKDSFGKRSKDLFTLFLLPESTNYINNVYLCKYVNKFVCSYCAL